jgi:hypothetical protein
MARLFSGAVRAHSPLRGKEQRRVGGSPRHLSRSARSGRIMIAKPSDPTCPAVRGTSQQVGGASAGYKLTPKSCPTRAGRLKATVGACLPGSSRPNGDPGRRGDPPAANRSRAAGKDRRESGRNPGKFQTAVWDIVGRSETQAGGTEHRGYGLPQPPVGPRQSAKG